MPVTKIIAIRTTLNHAIAYAIHPKKTENGKNTFVFGCDECDPKNVNELTKSFNEVRHQGDPRVQILAQHVIQSFKKDEVTPEQAMEICQETMKRFLGDKYQYVMGVHTDTDNIHVHVVFNNVDCLNFRSFETEYKGKHDASKSREVLRRISDRVCWERGVSIIENPEPTKGKSYYEYQQDKAGHSWKSQLKNEIDSAVMESDNFDDFLEKIRAKYIECVYTPQNVISLKFRMPGQQKFTRARTLGWYYEENQIRKRIAEYAAFRAGHSLVLPRTKLIDTDAKEIKQSAGLTRWAELQNIKEVSRALNIVAKYEVQDNEDLKNKCAKCFAYRMGLVQEIKDFDRQINTIDDTINLIKEYKKYAPIQAEWENTHFKKSYEKKHGEELSKYRSLEKRIKELYPDTLPKISELKAEKEELLQRKSKTSAEYKEVKELLTELDTARMEIDNYLSKQNERNAPNRKKNRREEIE